MTLKKLRLIIQLNRMRQEMVALGFPVGDMPMAQFYRRMLCTNRALKKAARASGITSREADEAFQTIRRALTEAGKLLQAERS